MSTRLFLATIGLLSGGIAGQDAAAILRATGTRGGLVVHLGCGDGTRTAALRGNESYLVHGLDRSPANVRQARDRIAALGRYGEVSADLLRGQRLPYIDNLVNLLVAEDLGDIELEEVLRVLVPNGVAYVKQGDSWKLTRKPRPSEIDEWTHYLHDASNNAVAHDTVVGPPRHLQWLGSPRWSRHHDHMASTSAMVSAGGRVFYILDQGSRTSILLPSKWSLVARDAFNGVILWQRPIQEWFTHMWRLKSGPALLPRRLVAKGDRVWVTLGINAPVSMLDAATGKTLRTYEGTGSTDEVLLSKGVLYLVARRPGNESAVRAQTSPMAKSGFWGIEKKRILALDAGGGGLSWQRESQVTPLTLTAGEKGVYFHDGRSVVSLDPAHGNERWRSEPVPVRSEIPSWFGPSLVLSGDVVFFAGGEKVGQRRGGQDKMTALDAASGKVLWKSKHGPSGYRSPEDLLVAGGLVWEGETTQGRLSGTYTGHDPRTGTVQRTLPPDLETYWFHHRCYRAKATDRYLLTSRTGIEFLDLENGTWTIHHWVRGGCLYGIMPCNGFIYTPPHDCACYAESKLYGFNALASRGGRTPRPQVEATTRLVRGPAYDDPSVEDAAPPGDWPTYRGDSARRAFARAAPAGDLDVVWRADIGGRLTSPTVAGGRVFVASVDSHTLHALEAGTGRALWSHTAGGRVDSPPTIRRGRVYFGCADGQVYCLRARDGALVWRYRAAPHDERLVAFEQLESVWPVHGSVLVERGIVHCTAGRSMFLDGGLRLLRLDAKTGRKLSETTLDDKKPGGGSLQDDIQTLQMPVALPDVLSSDGQHIYMRSQVFDREGRRLELGPHSGNAATQGSVQRGETAHLFAPFGFLDGSWFHRAYWVYGRSFAGGHNGYYQAGKFAPAGRILAIDGDFAYGYGRKPQYYKWTTTLEHHLFATDKEAPRVKRPAAGATGTFVHIDSTPSLDPSGKPLTVQAWVRADQPNGVVLAHGGPSRGYALFLQRGKPKFALRAGGEVTVVTGDQDVRRRWVHLAGVLTSDKKLRLYVDGKLAASSTVPQLIESRPAQSLDVGLDQRGAVGGYRSPNGFTGLIDEVSVHHRALDPLEVRRGDRRGSVLAWSFDDGKAMDASGNGHHGEVTAATPAKGKVGQALRFVRRQRPAARTHVEFRWSMDVPILVRAMLVGEDALFVAGPPDLVDEEEARGRLEEPATAARLLEQDAALRGEHGARLLVIGKHDGKTRATYPLESPPVWDGMVAARGRLYLATLDGRVLSMAKR